MSKSLIRDAALLLGGALVASLLTVKLVSVSGEPQVEAKSFPAGTGAPAPGAELALLREQVAALRVEMRTRQGMTPEAGEPVEPAALADLPDSAPQPTFEEEKVDASWATESEQRVRKAFAAIEDTKLENVECRASSCRVRYTAADIQSAQRMARNAEQAVGALASGGSMEPGTNATQLTLVMRAPTH